LGASIPFTARFESRLSILLYEVGQASFEGTTLDQEWGSHELGAMNFPRKDPKKINKAYITYDLLQYWAVRYEFRQHFSSFPRLML